MAQNRNKTAKRWHVYKAADYLWAAVSHERAMFFPSHREALTYVNQQINNECPTCQRSTVIDTDWGWECNTCGSYDIATGCTKP